jgi:hypothetical protein
MQTRKRMCGKPNIPNVIANCFGSNVLYRNCSTWKCPGKYRNGDIYFFLSSHHRFSFIVSDTVYNLYFSTNISVYACGNIFLFPAI